MFSDASSIWNLSEISLAGENAALMNLTIKLREKSRMFRRVRRENIRRVRRENNEEPIARRERRERAGKS